MIFLQMELTLLHDSLCRSTMTRMTSTTQQKQRPVAAALFCLHLRLCGESPPSRPLCLQFHNTLTWITNLCGWEAFLRVLRGGRASVSCSQQHRRGAL